MLVDARGQTNGSFTCGPSWPVSTKVASGQPFALEILQALVELSEDPDKNFVEHLAGPFRCGRRQNAGSRHLALQAGWLTQ